MRILALLTDGFGAGGGIAAYNRNFLRALSMSEHVTGVVALPRFGDARVATPAKVAQLPAVAGRAAWALRAASLALRGGFDAIFCGHLNAAPLAGALARFTGKPLWVQLHGIEAWEPREGAARRAVESARLVTAVSRYTRARLLAWSDLDPARARVLSNTFEPMPASEVDPATLAARHGLENRRVILTVGRLAPGEQYKGHDRIIAAMPEVLRRAPDAAYLVAGSGGDLERLRELAGKAGVAGSVVFAGQVAESELAGYFRLARVFAMPSTGEGFGIVFLEAVAAGVPVVAGNVDGSVDALADGALGTLVDPRDGVGLADAIVAGLEGRARVESAGAERFAFPHFARHVNDLVERFR